MTGAPVIGQGGAAPQPPQAGRGPHYLAGGPSPTTTIPNAAIWGGDAVGRIVLPDTVVATDSIVVMFATPYMRPTGVVSAWADLISPGDVTAFKYDIEKDRINLTGIKGPATVDWNCSETTRDPALLQGGFDPASAMVATNGRITNSNHTMASIVTADSAYYSAVSIISHNFATEKVYAEFYFNSPAPGVYSDVAVGLGTTVLAPPKNWAGATADSIGLFSSGDVYVNGALIASLGNAGEQTGAFIVGMAVGFGKVWWRVNNGPWNNSTTDDPATGTGGFAVPAGANRYMATIVSQDISKPDVSLTVQGQAPWQSIPPAGYVGFGA
jgi:hypothetical protein